ncbi:MAG: GIY-YIG nuclease family protein [Bacillota bacterium]|jgi:excinuclease ABC subunit C
MNLKETLKELPQKPGVYLMMDSRGNIIYIGKAKNLKNRVSQYFRNQKNRDPKVAEMINHISAFKYFVTDTELDALINECRLIKKIKPRYNRLMKNSGKYIYIKISCEQYPKVIKVNEKADDEAQYFGPFTSPHRVDAVLQYLNESYPIRKCPNPGLVKRPNGCLYQQLGSCLGVCTGQVTPEIYRIHIENICRLLNGNDAAAVPALLKKLDRAVEHLNFEKAAQYREYFFGLKHIFAKQRLIHSASKNRNILAVEFIGSEQVKLFLIKGNKLLYRKVFDIAASNSIELMQCLRYILPKKILSENSGTSGVTQYDIDEAQIIYSYLKKHKKSILSFWIPSTKLQNEVSVNALTDTILKKIRTHHNQNTR